MEKVAILAPPAFAPTGQVLPRTQAIKAQVWLGVFHLWIVQRQPVPALIYQQRSPNSSWGPLLLDVTVGGYYLAGEHRLDGLREVKEELGIHYNPKTLTYLGRKLFFGRDQQDLMRYTVVDIHLVEDNRRLDQFVLDPQEVHALCLCPIDYLIKMHTRHKPFSAPTISNSGHKTIIKVTPDLIPYNWDNYHFKIALLARRFLRGENNLIY